MKKVLLILSILLTITLIQAEEENHKEHKLHWGYEGDASPKHWGDLNDKFFMCKEGTNQSPINLTNFIEAELPPIKFNYHLVSTEILDNGHTEQISVKGGSHIELDGMKFELKQFHFHTPSENNINGSSYPLEVHFVHASEDNKLAVVAVMFREGKANEALKELWKNMPTHTGEHHHIDAKHLDALLPRNRMYYRFNGSLTTPPCTEGVRWLVMKHAIPISKKQIKKFAEIMHQHNNRPIQPTNARMILK